MGKYYLYEVKYLTGSSTYYKYVVACSKLKAIQISEPIDSNGFIRDYRTIEITELCKEEEVLGDFSKE